MTPLDATDARILLALDRDPQATVVALAQDLNLARNTVQARLRRLNADGALSEHSRRVEPEALGYPLQALITISISQRERSGATHTLSIVPEVVELLTTTGSGDMLARVVARDTDDLDRVTELILTTPGVERTSTAIVLKKVRTLHFSSMLRRLAGIE